MPQWRVGSDGLRVINRDGSESRLPPGAVIDEIPVSYEGTLTLVEWERRRGYDTKVIQPEIGLD